MAGSRIYPWLRACATKGVAMQGAHDLGRTLSSVLVTLVVVVIVSIAESNTIEREPPAVTEGPSPKFYYKEGQANVYLPCQVAGSPPPKITWYRNGELLNAGVTERWNGTRLYLQTGSRREAEGYYQCHATNQWGVAVSNMSHVQLAVLKKRRTGAGKVEDFEPPITLPCTHALSIPPPRPTWYTVQCDCADGSTSLVTNDIQEGAPCAECYITSYKVDPACKKSCREREVEYNDSISHDKDGGLLLLGLPRGDWIFKCKAYNPILKKALFGYARVIVNSPPTKHKKNYFSENPTTVLEGGDTSLQCVFAGSTTAQVVWKKDGEEVTDAADHVQLRNKGTTLAFRNTTLSDEGDYSCRVNGSTFANVIRLHVHQMPQWETRLEDATTEEGSTAVFTCRGRGKPAPLVIWSYNGQPIQKVWKKSYNISMDGSRLNLGDVTLEDSGIILCNISNRYGSRILSASLHVIPRREVPATEAPTPKPTEGEQTEEMSSSLMDFLSTTTTNNSNQTTNNTTAGREANITASIQSNGSLITSGLPPDESTTSDLTTVMRVIDAGEETKTSSRKGEYLDRTGQRPSTVVLYVLLPFIFLLLAILLICGALFYRRRRIGKEYEVEKREQRFGLNPMRDKDYDSDDSGIGYDEKEGLKGCGRRKKRECDVRHVDLHI